MPRRAFRFWLAPGLLCSALAVGADAPPAPQSNAEARVERYLASLSTWSADFAQTIDDASGKTLRSASGHLYLQRPGKFRWDYQKPVVQLLIADGKKLWFYDQDLKQADVRDMDAAFANTPAALLSGGEALESQFTISALPASEGLEWYQLIPKRADSDFQAVRIGFAKGELAQMLLADKLNQVTSLKFSAAKRNVAIPADLFSFTPPPGVDVIDGAAP